MAQRIFEVFKEQDEAIPVAIDFWKTLEKNKKNELLDAIYSFNVFVYDITDSEPVDVTNLVVLPGSVRKKTSLKYGTETVITFALINGAYGRKYDAKFQVNTDFGFIFNEHIFFKIADQQT